MDERIDRSSTYRTIKFLGIPGLTILYTFVFDGHALFTGQMCLDVFIKNIGYTFLFVLAIWQGCEWIVSWVDCRYPWEKNTKKRLIIQTLLVSLWCSFIIVSGILLIFWLNDMEINVNHILLNLLITNMSTIAVNAVIASLQFFKGWKKSLLENEQLKKEQVMSEFTALKNQVNPHFLFNCLNTLTTLIEEEPSIATKYVHKLASVYRYVLTHKDMLEVSIEEELKFLEDYIFLNKMRFEENLVVTIRLEENILHKNIITLGMQMLVENAIKHNIISKAKPLHIDVHSSDGYISISNNLQRKATENSTGIGLSNIQSRYKAIGIQKEVTITETPERFEVKLPII